MNILLTGSSGFLGSRVLYQLKEEGHQVMCIPSAVVRDPKNPENKRSLELYFAENKPDAVVHTAAIADTGYAERNPEESYLANVELPLMLAQLSEKYAAKLVSCSSDQVYTANTAGGPFTEEETPEPRNVYGRHKLLAESLVSEICPDAVHLRLTWMYDLPQYGQRTNGNIVLNLLRTLISGKAARYSTSDYRGLTYVRTVTKHLAQSFKLAGGAYNFGSENDKNMYVTASDFLLAMGYGERARDLILPDDSQEWRSLAMNCSKLHEEGIFFPSTAEGIRLLVQDYPGMFI